MIRKASAHWKGNGKEGQGHLVSDSTVLNNTPYSFKTRFENEDGKAGTNPEELVAAAHAGCFSMKLAFNLQAAGFAAESIETTCAITLEAGSITHSALYCKVKLEGIESSKFDELIQDAKANCPISKLLNTHISLDYQLN